ncbi:MAG: hypothetical protein ACOC56_05300, partial [Atribacterota bacterium]
MNIIISNLDNECDCFTSTCVLKGLRKKYYDQNFHVDFVVKHKSCLPIFKYNENIRSTFVNKTPNKNYDIYISLSKNPLNIKTKKRLGIVNNS